MEEENLKERIAEGIREYAKKLLKILEQKKIPVSEEMKEVW